MHVLAASTRQAVYITRVRSCTAEHGSGQGLSLCSTKFFVAGYSSALALRDLASPFQVCTLVNQIAAFAFLRFAFQ